jgi:hypothetical protein
LAKIDILKGLCRERRKDGIWSRFEKMVSKIFKSDEKKSCDEKNSDAPETELMESRNEFQDIRRSNFLNGSVEFQNGVCLALGG